MKRSLLLIALLAACAANEKPNIQPDDPNTSMSSSDAAASSGVGGSNSTGSGGSSAGGSNAGGSNQSPPGWESGTRLRAVVIKGSDGSKQFYRWRDTTLNVDCVFRSASDGKMRCIPWPAAIGGYFSDASCTSPVALQLHNSCTPPKYAILTTATCDPSGESEVFSLGQKLAPTVYTKSGANCVGPQNTNNDVFAVGAKVPPSQFVEGSYVVE